MQKKDTNRNQIERNQLQNERCIHKLSKQSKDPKTNWTQEDIMIKTTKSSKRSRWKKKKCNLQQTHLEQKERDVTTKDLLNREKMGVTWKYILGD